MPKPGDVLKSGHWIYGGKTRCRVEIQFGSTRPGSGDHEDTPELREDQTGIWFVVSYASPTEPDRCPPAWRYAQGCPRLEEAITEAETTLRRCDLEWEA